MKELVNEVKSWTYESQLRFLNQVAWNTSIGIRSIISNNNLVCGEKLEAIRWLNEFQHTTNELHFLINSTSANQQIKSFIKNIIFFSNKNKTTKNEIIEILNLSFESVKNHRNFKS